MDADLLMLIDDYALSINKDSTSVNRCSCGIELQDICDKCGMELMKDTFIINYEPTYIAKHKVFYKPQKHMKHFLKALYNVCDCENEYIEQIRFKFRDFEQVAFGGLIVRALCHYQFTGNACNKDELFPFLYTANDLGQRNLDMIFDYFEKKSAQYTETALFRKFYNHVIKKDDKNNFINVLYNVVVKKNIKIERTITIGEINKIVTNYGCFKIRYPYWRSIHKFIQVYYPHIYDNYSPLLNIPKYSIIDYTQLPEQIH